MIKIQVLSSITVSSMLYTHKPRLLQLCFFLIFINTIPYTTSKKKRKMRNNFKIYRNCDKKISINRLSLVVMLQLFQETSSTPYTQVHPKLLHNKKIYRKANKKESKQIVANMSWMSRSCQNKKSINQKTNTKTNTQTNKSSTKRMRN